MKKQKIMILSIVLLIIIGGLGFGGYFVYNRINDAKQELALVKDFEETASYLEAGEFTKAKEQLKTTNATDDYLVVEQVVKDSMLEIVEVVEKVQSLEELQNLQSFNSPENLQADGPDFTNTKKQIETAKTTITDFEKVIEKFESPDKFITVDKTKDFNDKQLKVIEKIKGGFNAGLENSKIKAEITQMSKMMGEVNKLLTKKLEILDFLSSNEGKWSINAGQLQSSDSNFVEQYNRLIGEHNSLAANMLM
ncbi:MAG: hypothetical protein ACRCUP_02330 [Mycoplasmatales bacterium]